MIVDPSHATGQWSLVEAVRQAALAFGAHGLLIEVLEGERSRLRCDAEQGIPWDMLERIAHVTKVAGMTAPVTA